MQDSSGRRGEVNALSTTARIPTNEGASPTKINSSLTRQGVDWSLNCPAALCDRLQWLLNGRVHEQWH
jgi:hypothetical protein